MRSAATSLIMIALTLIRAGNALSEQSAGTRDHLCGWYKFTTGNRLIPVFKIDGTYYTVISRGGFEIPLKECPDGLEWPATPPSSMAGTKIGFNEDSNEIYISIVDQNREYQDASFTSGKKQSMTAIGKPSWLRDATAQPARTNDDFLAGYEPVWCPHIRGQIRKESGKYLLAYQVLQKTGDKRSWVPHNKQYELTALPDRLGFAMGLEDEQGLTVRFIYSTSRRRFELQLSNVVARAHVSRMPLVRIPSPSPEHGAAPLPPMDIGIPSWN